MELATVILAVGGPCAQRRIRSRVLADLWVGLRVLVPYSESCSVQQGSQLGGGGAQQVRARPECCG